MPRTWTDLIRTRPIAAAAAAVAVGGAATVLGFLFFQYVLGYPPCPLCLEQRYAYYFAIPLAGLILVGESVGSSRKVLLAALVVIAVGMVWNTGLGIYHAGIEWKWWPGPQDCSGPIDAFGSASDLLKRLESISVVRCDEAAWRLFGLSLAGYNALVSLALAALAAWGFIAGYRRSDPA